MFCQRACALSRIHHDTIPEEMFVKEVLVTKGRVKKNLTMMGKGRAGVGYTRWAHVTVKVDKVDFEKMIADAKTPEDQKKWTARWAGVKQLKESGVVPPSTPLDHPKRQKQTYNAQKAEA